VKHFGLSENALNHKITKMTIHHSINTLKDLWKRAAPAHEALLQFEFFSCLEDSGSIGPEAGWGQAIFSSEDSLLINFIKSHSYGEYIFDWDWARAFDQYKTPYYPKLTSMLPLTPVTTSHFVMKEFNEIKAQTLLSEAESFMIQNKLSSSHYLFLPKNEISLFEKNNYLLRHSFQYHFENKNYENFEHFLTDLKTKKAKNLSHERHFPELEIKQYTGDSLRIEHADRMYQFYLLTIDKKNSYSYLKADFFKLIFERMKNSILYVEATHEEEAIAGSLFFYDSSRLYGRYWGSSREVQNLHFELCYYQGMDFCFEKKIPLFEAGAQGEHKVSRGFRPVVIHSAHKIQHPGFSEAIGKFIASEKKNVDAIINELSERLPFKHL
jgi:predicted N-acyltransferase